MNEMKLIISSPQFGSRELRLTSSASIGRSSDNTIHIDEPSLARYQAMIELRGNGFWLNDLGSNNGTVLNGVPLTAEQQLKSGDTISLGKTTAIRVESPNAAATAPPPAPVQQTATTPAASPAPTPAPENGISMAHIAIAGVMVFVILGFIGTAFWIIRGKSPAQNAQNGTPNYYTPSPAPTKSLSNPDGTKPTPTQEPTKTVVLPPGTASGVEGLVGKLAGQLSGKGNYIFDPEMVAAIAARTGEYRVDVTAQAKAYRLEVDRAFSNAKAMKPLLGHILAMSNSRYGQSRGNGVGVWQIPPSIAQEYATQGEDLTALNTPKRSAEVAAAHLQEITTIFSPEDFMYALACFGQPRSYAGTLNQRLQSLDPNDRRNFWKQVKSGLVPREGAEKVVRFFAAGIVGEYPSNFGLAGATPFSEM
jgi:pSer/pThr/pTyr-binding forkhead associated (FHA) protein